MEFKPPSECSMAELKQAFKKELQNARKNGPGNSLPYYEEHVNRVLRHRTDDKNRNLVVQAALEIASSVCDTFDGGHVWCPCCECEICSPADHHEDCPVLIFSEALENWRTTKKET